MRLPSSFFSRWGNVLVLICAIVFAALVFWGLDVAPGVDWDEGWTFSVAQNWVERGFYGRLLDNELAPPGLEASFPVVSSVALAFRVLGVGIWQGRFAGAVTMLLALALYVWLLRRLFSSSIAWTTLALLIFLVPLTRANVFWMARAMFAEPFQMLTILAGLAAWFLSRAHARVWILGAALGWGIAIVSKAQVLPFLVTALVVASAFNFLNRRGREGIWLACALLIALGVWQLWPSLLEQLLRGWTMRGETSSAVYLVLGLVLTWEIRFTALVLTILVGAPFVLGLGYVAYKRARRGRIRQFWRFQSRDDDIRIALWTLAATWFAWYAFFSHAGISRYIFSPIFFSAPFAAVMFYDFTVGLNLGATMTYLTEPLRTRRFSKKNLGAWFAFALVLFYAPLTLFLSYQTAVTAEGRQVIATTNYLNQFTPANARVETYESPLFIYLDRPYHYPPDALHLELNKRAARLPARVEYDALASDPDYLVVGPTGQTWRLYEAALASGAFRPLQTFGQYAIYQRVRP